MGLLDVFFPRRCYVCGSRAEYALWNRGREWFACFLHKDTVAKAMEKP